MGDAFLKATSLQFPSDRDRKAAENSLHKFFVDNGKMRSVMVALDCNRARTDENNDLSHADQEEII